MAVEPSRADRIRILFIAEIQPGRTSERSPMILETLSKRHEVVLLSPPWDRLVYDPSRARAPRILLYLLDKALLVVRALWLARRRRPDAVFCETVHHAVAGLVAARILGARCVWDSHGNGKLFYQNLGKSPRAIRWIAALEKVLGERVDELITVSERDASAYAGMGVPPSKIHVIPSGVRLRDLDAAARESEESTPGGNGGLPVLLFFGSFGYAPNREALEFVNDVLAPYLERQGNPCEIRIAGREIPSRRFHPFVRAVGFVPDIHAAIRAANLCIVPVRRGVGLLVKVLDAMAVGTPVVLSDFAASGIPDIRHEVHALVAPTDEDFLRYVTSALSDPSAGRTMARRARALIERKFDWDLYAEPLDAIVRGSPDIAMAREAHEGRDYHLER